ncbi:MAG: GUN4 domain-containing protein [Cyanobacteria bacterium P01_C01_bin.120]
MEPIKPAQVDLRIISTTLNVAERERAIKVFRDDLIQLNLVNEEQIELLRDSQRDDTLHGLQVAILQPEQLALWLHDISDRLDSNGATSSTICLTCTIDHQRVQILTNSADELRGFIPVVNMILPARQIFQTQAAAYAAREGEFSPVEEENLRLLCHQLNLDPEVAEEVKELALGPYQTRQEKLARYHEVLIDEIERHLPQPPPLPDPTQAELERLRKSLGLSPEDVEPLTREETAKHLPPPVDDAKAAQAAAEAAKKQAALRQKQTEKYRQLFASTIAQRLEPIQFDQGRLEQARRIWELDKELVQKIEREVTDEHYGPTDSAIPKQDYTRLRRLLYQQQWEEADKETEYLMLSGFSTDMRPLSETTVSSLSQYCDDVRTIDQLWSRHSQGKFGFAAQYQAYAKQEQQPGDFLAAVGWLEGISIGGATFLPRPIPYRELQFDLQALDGHLPTWRWAAESLAGDYIVSEDVVQTMFQQVVERCLPHLKAAGSPLSTEASAEKP